MRLSDFDFSLPEELIATRPASPRGASRLLVATPTAITDAGFAQLPDYLRSGDRLVLNNTKVIPARLTGTRRRNSSQGMVSARIEVTLLEPEEGGEWRALIKPLRKLAVGETVVFSNRFSAELIDKTDGVGLLRFHADGISFDEALAESGAMPLPPYIAAKRPADGRDKQDYQTVWARHSGAVAAPTASLHFDQAMLDTLRQNGVDVTYVTLHVGAGTFLPVKNDDVSKHKMHSEWGEVTATAAKEIDQTKRAGGRIIPVGTTALRLIETATDDTSIIHPWQGPTAIFIKPGYEFRITDALITNFHLPKSTLMMLVSALIGTERVREIYRHAIDNNYRFFSYGDASLLLPDVKNTTAQVATAL